MSWTKRDIINQAYEEIGMGGLVYDMDPQNLETALVRLDAIVSRWMEKGVDIPYPTPENPEESDIDDETMIASDEAEALYLALAVRVAPTVGKTVSIETATAAKAAYDTVLGKYMRPKGFKDQNIRDTGLPPGSGHKPWRYY